MTMWDWLRHWLPTDTTARTSRATQAVDTAQSERQRATRTAATWDREERRIRTRAANIADLLLDARDGAERGESS